MESQHDGDVFVSAPHVVMLIRLLTLTVPVFVFLLLPVILAKIITCWPRRGRTPQIQQSNYDHPLSIPRIIGFDGNVASGKSTLVKSCSANSSHAYVETVEPHLLNLFYKKPKRYAFPLQLQTSFVQEQMLTDAQAKIANARANISDSQATIKEVTCLIDRTPVGNLAFALMHIWNKFMTIGEYRVYANLKHLTQPSDLVKSLDRLVYLHSRPDICVKNVANRGGVDKDTPMTAMMMIDTMHVSVLWQLLLHIRSWQIKTPIYIVDWTRFGSITDIKATLGQSVDHVRQPRLRLVLHRSLSLMKSAKHRLRTYSYPYLSWSNQDWFQWYNSESPSIINGGDCPRVAIPLVWVEDEANPHRLVLSEACKHVVNLYLAAGRRVAIYGLRSDYERSCLAFVESLMSMLVS